MKRVFFAAALAVLLVSRPALAGGGDLIRLYEDSAAVFTQYLQDTRSAVPVGARLEQVLELPDAPRLHFAHASSGQEAAFDLVVSLLPADASPLRLSYKAAPKFWKDATVDLAAYAGKRVSVVFETQDEGVLLNSPMISRPGRKPNVVVIGLDTMRADHLDCYRPKAGTSPKIAQWAAGATLFENAYSHTSWTLPSFASILTGLYPNTHGVYLQKRTLGDDHDTLGEAMRRSGYFTFGVYGGHLVGPEHGFEAGMDRYRKALMNGYAERGFRSWLTTHQDVPFYLFIHSYQTHLNLIGMREDLLKQDPNLTGKEIADILVPRYDKTVRVADDLIGGLIASLRETGHYDNTYIIFISDHGEEFFEHGNFMHGSTLYEEVLRVPFIVSGPGIPAGKRVKDLVETVDMMPTVVELLGLGGTQRMDGRSLASYFSGSPEARDQYTIGQLGDDLWSIRTPAWSFARQEKRKRNYLFDRRSDRAEQKENSLSHPAAVRRLTEMYRRIDSKSRASSAKKTGTFRQTEETLAELRSLGYVS